MIEAGVTARLAQYASGIQLSDVPADVRRHGARTLLNHVASAIGGSREPAVERALAAVQPFSGPATASVLGRSERLDAMYAAFINGVSSHIQDFDDTHLQTIIHAGSPVVSAAFAAAEWRPTRGRDFLNAMLAGIEITLRIGRSVSPDHYDRGWHITGTCGVFGAAAAAGRILGLTTQQMTWALGLAASTPVGLRESFGSMNKSFNPGKAASDGILAALLAQRDFSSSETMIEARRGWANTISPKCNLDVAVQDLGSRFESERIAFKPFACLVMLHPVIDAAIQLRREAGLRPEDIGHVEIRVHPLVLELAGKRTPRTGLQGKFSVYHAVAIAFLQGVAGPREFSDEAVQDLRAVNLRTKISTIVDAGLHEDQARIFVRCQDRRRLEKFVEHALGSNGRPMSDEALEDKFRNLTKGHLARDRSEQLLKLCWEIEEVDDISKLSEVSSPND
jgi:2-methylcitrate dehydratase PrpD